MSILPKDKVIFLEDATGGFKKGVVYKVGRYSGRGDGKTEEEQHAVILTEDNSAYYYANDPGKLNKIWRKYAPKNTKPEWL